MRMEKKRSGTIIGKSLRIKGEIVSDEELIVQGKVEGTIEQSMDLFIEDGGEIRANINVPSIQIGGRMLGNITATNKVELLPGGTMVGDIVAAPRVEIMDGAKFKGKIDMGDVIAGAEGGASPAPSQASNAMRGPRRGMPGPGGPPAPAAPPAAPPGGAPSQGA